MTEQTRSCTLCGIPKPLTSANFETRTHDKVKRVFRAQCRVCRRLPASKRPAGCSVKPGRQVTESAKICSTCGGMPWRVTGIRCKCGLRYAAEPKPELVTRNFERTG